MNIFNRFEGFATMYTMTELILAIGLSIALGIIIGELIWKKDVIEQEKEQ